MNLQELKARHPVPWSYATRGSQVFVLDAVGREVPLFTIVELALHVSKHLASEPSPN